jgi:hypothetical protein
VHILHDIMRTLISAIEKSVVDTFARAIDYLAGNARRAHPKRDRQRGRLHFSLESIFGIVNCITYESLLCHSDQGQDLQDVAIGADANSH